MLISLTTSPTHIMGVEEVCAGLLLCFCIRTKATDKVMGTILVVAIHV